MTNKKYCIMDMDGTLIGSMPYWNTLSPDYLVSRGITKSTEGLIERLRTMTMPEACVYLKKEYELPESPEELLTALNGVMRRHYEEDIPLKKGVREHLEELTRQGAKLCVVTATAIPLVRLCLERLDVVQYFDFLMSCEEVGCGKDRPDAFLEAARRLGASPQEIYVYEDSLTALKTAADAGFRTVAVYDPYSGGWDQCAALSDETITDWT